MISPGFERFHFFLRVTTIVEFGVMDQPEPIPMDIVSVIDGRQIEMK